MDNSFCKIVEEYNFLNSDLEKLFKDDLKDKSNNNYAYIRIDSYDKETNKFVIFGEITNDYIEKYFNVITKYVIKNKNKDIDTITLNSFNSIDFFANYFTMIVDSDYIDEISTIVNRDLLREYKSFENLLNFKYHKNTERLNSVLRNFKFIVEIKNEEYEEGIKSDYTLLYKDYYVSKVIKLIFNNALKANKTMDKALKMVIKNTSKFVLNDFLAKEIKTYRVGQAGFNVIDDNIVYDIGFTRSLSKEPINHQNIINLSKNAMKKINPDIFIISHTDADHINGTIIVPNNIKYSKEWIFPKQIHDTKQAKMLIFKLYLFNKSKLHFIDINTEVKGNNIAIISGDGKTRIGSNKKNNSGLLLWLKNGDHEALLTGDCVYDSIQNYSNNYLKNYNYLVVPHHCPNVSNRNINYFTNGNQNKQYAILPVGYDPSNKHPDVNHMNKLLFNYQVIRTDDLTKIKQHQEYISYDLVNNKIHF